jgi:hypothetical protein
MDRQLLRRKSRKTESKVVRFDHYSKSAWRKLNRESSSLSGLQWYEKAFDVYYEILEDIQDIAKQACPIASDETRRNALEGLRKIAKTVCLSGGDTLTHEVNMPSQGGRQMTDAMLSVVDAMSDQERIFVRNSWKPDGTRLFIDTLDELVSLSQEERISEDLEFVLSALGKEDEPGEVEDEDQKGPDAFSVQLTQ